MEANKVLHSSILDIVFDGRNKEYGAYDLRKNYNKRLLASLSAMMGVTGLLFVIFFVVQNNGGTKKEVMMVKDVQLEQVVEEKKSEPLPPPPPPPKVPLQKIEITRFTPPKIVKDNEVKEEDKPPVQEKLEDTRIGTINQEGIKDEGITAPPVSDAGKGVVEAPKAKVVEDYDKTFTKVEIESEYPGGPAAWLRYLNKNFHYPDDALANEIQGVVMVQFIVDKDGNVSDVQAVSGPEEGGLRAEAIRVIRKSGTWIPAIQNGRKVKSYKRQPVIFKIASA
ncbi:TonB family protein [Flavitalea sp. BT771]|uniref:energy transducer TonB n=1 Tax=Flavitalea sp. BT771 TaxID=3063329 RepID=UPI0026E13521|nr:energy transducer TonB [Flavitalea sp. BT771]MDO6429514.1 TonB family protein [Flavitalea sp. BT771]MDV6218358.1 TonB family protein [Flavitalea sp. BT771]